MRCFLAYVSKNFWKRHKLKNAENYVIWFSNMDVFFFVWFMKQKLFTLQLHHFLSFEDFYQKMLM